jgi:palmitoyl transferase
MVICACAFANTARADWWEKTKDVLVYKYDRSKEAIVNGRSDYFLSGLIYHAPYAYDSHTRTEANEAGYGVGFGRSAVDPNGNTHTIYAHIFRASHYKPEYNGGYMWTTYWPLLGRLQGGLGYTVFFFIRPDLGYDYPTPAALPVGTLRYDKFELLATWIPGVAHGSGSVGFLFGRFNF